MWIIKNRKIFYILSLLLVIISISSIFIYGLQFGIDFKGGSIIEIKFLESKPDTSIIEKNISDLAESISLGNYVLQSIGESNYSLKSRLISDIERQKIENAFSDNNSFPTELVKINSVGPLIGKEASQKSLISIILVLACIILFISFAFRKVSRPVSAWKYGLMAILALAHDIIIPIGVFSILGYYLNYQVDTLFVTALLVILGSSIHDTIVAYDRIRENLHLANKEKEKKDFETIVGESISQTIMRSINTSLTTVLALIALYFLGPRATQHFSLVLIIGVIVGTYSSIFIASALLVTIEKHQKKY